MTDGSVRANTPRRSIVAMTTEMSKSILHEVASVFPWRLVQAQRLLHDRFLLEQVIFPALEGDPIVSRVLFVGCDRSTASYPALFSDTEFITIDSNPSKARYGARRHVTDRLANLRAHFAERALDAVVCNGVFGWGLDQADEINESVSA